MQRDEIVWRDSYNVGIEYIDNAHKKLFELVSKVSDVINDPEKSREGYACYEAINFLKSYTVQHFAEEEGYMKKINYPGYKDHKAVHDNLKDVVLPDFEEKFKKSRFSKEVVTEFVALITGWLYGHILIEDMAITGKAASRYHESDEDVKITLQNELERFGRDFIGIKSTLTDSKYEGRIVSNALYYEMIFREGFIVTVIADNRIIRKIAENITGRKQESVNKIVLTEYIQIIQSIAKASLRIIKDEGNFNLLSHRVFNAEELQGLFLNNLPEYSMLWNSELGEVAICILKC